MYVNDATGGTSTSTVALAVLLAGFGSVEVDAIDAVFCMWPDGASGATV